MESTKYEVIVVGAGPAGLNFARNYGAGCLVLEARPFVNQDKVCGEAITSRGVNELNLSQEDMRSIIVNETKSIRIFPPVYDKRSPGHGAPASKAKSCFVAPERTYMINRNLMAEVLAAKAIENGATLLTSHRVTSVQNDGTCVTVTAQSRRFFGEIVVFADGSGTMSPQLGFSLPKERVVCFQYILSGVQLEDTESVEVFGLSRSDPSGYIWIFPRGDNLFHVGIGFSTKFGTKKSPKQCLDEFIRDGNAYGGRRRFGQFRTIGSGGGIVLLGGFNRNSYSDRAIVIGEAAGCANSLSGGGIRTALSSGRVAASVVKAAIRKGDVGADALSAYPCKYYKEEGALEDICLKLRTIYEAETVGAADSPQQRPPEENNGLSFDEILKAYYCHKKMFVSDSSTASPKPKIDLPYAKL